VLREGSGDPLVLFHPLLGSERAWARVLPLLAPHHDTIAITALGHRGGPPATQRPALVAHLIDDAERQLRALGLDRAHLAGCSLGGWVALELARRGLARSVCAISPAGCWIVGSESHRRAEKTLHDTVNDTRATRPLLPLIGRIPAVRRFAMRPAAVHGDRLTFAELRDVADDVLGCEPRDELIDTTEALAPLDPVPCPITLAWSGSDRLLRIEVDGARARELVPGARWIVLPDVGHVAMVDDPELVAKTILESTGAVAA
jgi:pimeloyl-ACP methyl ester carboxylesterase